MQKESDMLLKKLFLLVSFMVGTALFNSFADENLLYMQNEHWPPYIIFEEEGRVKGIDVEILEEVARRLNVDFKVVETPWVRCLVDMEKGGADILSATLKRPEREKYMYYLEPPYIEYSTKCFYVRKGSGVVIENYSDIYKLKVGITRGSAYFPQFDEDERVDKVTVADTNQLIKMLLAGHLDAFIGTEEVIEYFFLANESYDRSLVEKAAFEYRLKTPFHFTISRKSPFMARVPEIERILRALIREGYVEKVKKRYLGR